MAAKISTIFFDSTEVDGNPAHGDTIANVERIPGQLWERLAEHSLYASGYEEHFTGPEEVDNVHDTDEYLFSDD